MFAYKPACPVIPILAYFNYYEKSYLCCKIIDIKYSSSQFRPMHNLTLVTILKRILKLECSTHNPKAVIHPYSGS
jgi:hypothetical protein